MIYYAIRHKPSGNFLPFNPTTRGTRGFTRVEPSAAIPRLFKRKQYAANALKWWLEGIFSTDNEGNLCFVRKPPERKAEDMEVVPVTLTVAEAL